MTKYTIVIMILFYMSRGIHIGKRFTGWDVASELAISYHVIVAMLMAPIFGRILGWW